MILLLAGTADGREILAALKKKGLPVIATVTTAYGGQILNGQAPAQIIVHPLDHEEIINLIIEKGIVTVIDASHPFAARVSSNALQACAITGAKYIRYERLSCELADCPLIFRYRDFHQAAQKATSFGETIFLTTGSKTLDIFFQEAKRAGKKVVARVLPDPEVLNRCLVLGLKPSEIIAMQGPFSYELNKALLIDYRASVLVTKESGPVGGTDNKIKAALDLGIPVILMERPVAAYPIVVSSCAELLEILRSGRRE